ASTDPAIAQLRLRDARSLLATLLLARGTPMLAMGDELGRTQQGNNNAYAQDNALTWIDWEHADQALIDFTAALIALRKQHPVLGSERWLTGAPADDSGMPDVEWRHPDGRDVTPHDWNRADNQVLIAILYAGASRKARTDRMAIAFNASRAPVEV